ncbi:glycosyltransferase [bacterium]|nr:glycosyltransferase [bacterium]
MITAVTFTSEDVVAFLNTTLPFHIEGIPLVVVGQDQRDLTKVLNCRTYEGGKTFGRKLLAGLEKVETEYFVFVHPKAALSNLDFLGEALKVLSSPEVGFVVPGLPKGVGPQSYKRKDRGALARIAPWCFAFRTEEAITLFEKALKVFQDERIVQLVCYELMKQGRFSYVLPMYTLDMEEDFSDLKLDARFRTQPLEPVLIYQYRRLKDIPSTAKSLFKDVIVCTPLDVPEIDQGKLIFVLREGEDFADIFTLEQLQRMCDNPDPFVFAYQFPVLRTWSDNRYLKDQVTWEIRAFASFEKIAPRILINPYYGQQLPYEGLRPVNVPIIKKVNDLPDNCSIARLRTPTLTIATIMKDEMKNLPTYLGTALPFAQQVILVDTGSQDESLSFAKRFGAEVLETKLDKDFSKARNLYLQRANGTWLLQQDLDEIVDYKQIYAVMLETPENTDAVQLQVHNLTPQEGTVIYQDAIRLVKNPRTWYYSNRVHETFERCATEENRVVSRVNDVVIYHLGFLSPRMKEKLSFYRELINMQLEEEPENPLPYFNLALDLLNEYEEHPENLDVALKLLLQATSLHPSFALAQYEVSRVYCQKALEAIERTLEVVPPQHPMVNAIKKVYGPLKEYTKRYIVR